LKVTGKKTRELFNIVKDVPQIPLCSIPGSPYCLCQKQTRYFLVYREAQRPRKGTRHQDQDESETGSQAADYCLDTYEEKGAF
jgi:hypothetical protein